MEKRTEATDGMRDFLAEIAITKTVTGYMVAVDARRWDDLAPFFAEEVFVDYTSVRAVPPAASLHREAMIARWRSRYDQVAAYQHELSNVVVHVSGDRAICTGNNAASLVRSDTEPDQMVLWQAGVRLNWELECRDQRDWVITSIRAEHVWDRTEPYRGQLRSQD
jgi:hypothetical protein